ncbi:MAG: hypothetical protein HEP71_30915, partial [Roseivirga sp.]|nr:hypothetical protein [Roseivirga sp.]
RDKAAAENKIPQGMVPVRILKPIQGYGYHTNDEGIISEEVIKEKDLVKNGFIELIK